MNVEDWGTLLTFLCLPAAVMFPLLYATTAPWWKSWSGRAVLTSKVGLALLVIAAAMFRMNSEVPYPGFDVLRIVAFGLITVGTYLYLFAFAREQYLRRNKP